MNRTKRTERRLGIVIPPVVIGRSIVVSRRTVGRGTVVGRSAVVGRSTVIGRSIIFVIIFCWGRRNAL